MGLLTEGSPLSWEETKKLSKHVREHGIEQFINLYRRLKDRTGDVLKWGDEVNIKAISNSCIDQLCELIFKKCVSVVVVYYVQRFIVTMPYNAQY